MSTVKHVAFTIEHVDADAIDDAEVLACIQEAIEDRFPDILREAVELAIIEKRSWRGLDTDDDAIEPEVNKLIELCVSTAQDNVIVGSRPAAT